MGEGEEDLVEGDEWKVGPWPGEFAAGPEWAEELRALAADRGVRVPREPRLLRLEQRVN